MPSRIPGGRALFAGPGVQKHGIAGDDLAEKLGRLLFEGRLDAFQYRPVRSLSGGQKHLIIDTRRNRKLRPAYS